MGLMMRPEINIYCDESCHLERDQSPVMVLGGVWAHVDACGSAARRLLELREKHGLPPAFEIKWVKVSPAKLAFYLDVIDYFFDNTELNFRGVVIPDKQQLDHQRFNQTHDDWYYKMHFVMLKQVLARDARYRIYIDIKDTRSQAKVEKLHDVICNSLLDFDRAIVERVQQVRSHEVQLLQLADLLIGAICYANRLLVSSDAKLAIVHRIRERSRLTLVRSTLPGDKKFNLLVWNARSEEA